MITLASVVTACGSQQPSGGERSGLHGTVVLSPATPVCRSGVPCSQPAEGVTLVFSRLGRTVATVKTRERGRYRIALAAGRYAVSVESRGTLKPAAATVPPGRFRRLDLTFDAGIR